MFLKTYLKKKSIVGPIYILWNSTVGCRLSLKISLRDNTPPYIAVDVEQRSVRLSDIDIINITDIMEQG